MSSKMSQNFYPSYLLRYTLTLRFYSIYLITTTHKILIMQRVFAKSLPMLRTSLRTSVSAACMPARHFSAAGTAQPTASCETLNNTELKQMSDSGVKYLFFDVRRADEIAADGGPFTEPCVHVSVGKLVDTDLFKHTDNAQLWKEVAGVEPPTKDTRIVFSCSSGMRATIAALLAENAGFENVCGHFQGPMCWKDNCR